MSPEPDASQEPESISGFKALVAQIVDPSLPATGRIAATNAARSFLEAITRNLVADARREGTSWLEIADLFVTSERNVKARFGDIRDYGDGDD
ncbi:MAG TPA: hypothetical protein VM388_03590 [Acidimicrobiales bacterium]|nr:hypothetical protein [Acidimicrobiales bacterium]